MAQLVGVPLEQSMNSLTSKLAASQVTVMHALHGLPARKVHKQDPGKVGSCG